MPGDDARLVDHISHTGFINKAMLVAVLATLAVLVLSILLVLRLSRSISQPGREAAAWKPSNVSFMDAVMVSRLLRINTKSPL